MSKQGKRKAAKTPVSAHPAFPAIVALWFAALLGIGSLVLPVALYERTAEATGLASIVTAAQAPLGVTARIVIALVAAAVGAVAGIEIARKVAASTAPRPVPRRAAALRPSVADEPAIAKRPISAHEELGLDSLDAASDDGDPMPGRRRALAVTDESAPSEFLDFAPVPGQSAAYEAAHTGALDLGEFAAAGDATESFEQDYDTFGSAALSAPPPPGAAFVPPAPQPDVAAEDDAMTRFEAAPVQSFVRAGEDPRFDEPTAFRSHPAGARPDFPAAPAPFAEPTGAVPLAAPTGQPAIADLVARFARALESHRAVAQDIAAPAPAPAIPAAFAPEPAAPAPTAFEPAPQAAAHVPLALRPIGFDDEEDADEALPDLDLTAALSRASRPFAGPAQAPVPQAFEAPAAAIDGGETDAEDFSDEEEDDDSSYSSLLAMKNPASLPREVVRIEDEFAGTMADEAIEPVVVFPGQAARQPASPAARPFDAPQDRIDALDRGTATAPRTNSSDTERALREALEKLQRMSGAA